MLEGIRGIAHRGYSKTAPENTIPAYVLAKEKGFKYVECDVQFTKDNIPVLIHDEDIKRTSNGSGLVAELDYVDLLEYDFGSWKDKEYINTRIATFEEFIKLCLDLNLVAYVEIKSSIDICQANILMDIVNDYEMFEDILWISFNLNNLKLIRDVDSRSSLGLIGKKLNMDLIDRAKTLKTKDNFVFLDVSYKRLNKRKIDRSVSHGLPVKVWTVDRARRINKLINNGVKGITSNFLNAKDLIDKKHEK